MTIFVDADACPVKAQIVDAARKRSVPVTMLIDDSHVLCDGYSTVITVEKGHDSVDFKLITLCKANDIVVTQDYGVAAMALGKGARCISQNGLLFTNSNIDELLYKRHTQSKARRKGHYTAIPKRTAADDAAFSTAFCRLLDEKGEP